MHFDEGWERRTLAELHEAVDACLRWHNEDRIKFSLGGLSLLRYRRKLRLCHMTFVPRIRTPPVLFG